MSLSRRIDSGTLWGFPLTRRELEVVRAALSGRRLSATEADEAGFIAERLETFAAGIDRQTEGE